MPIAIAFIRGINVGGKHPLPMATLRSLCEKLGLKDVRTHIQSGNVVFRCADKDVSKLAARLEDAIERAAGFRPAVVVRSVADVREALITHPFAREPGLNPSHVLVMFLDGPPASGAGAALRAVKVVRERVAVQRSEVYLHYPDGIGNSKLSMSAVEKAVGVPGTCRNLNTIEKMLALAAELESEPEPRAKPSGKGPAAPAPAKRKKTRTSRS